MHGPDVQEIEPPTSPTETFTVSISLVAPMSSGTYTGTWLIQNADGTPISDPLLANVIVYQPTATPTPAYPPPELTGLDIIGCSIAFKWTWPNTLAHDEYFAVRAGIGTPGESRTWTKSPEYTLITEDAGEYVWEVAICRGDPDTHICEQLAVSTQGVFEFRGCGGK
jgi:hypothetical protein